MIVDKKEWVQFVIPKIPVKCDKKFFFIYIYFFLPWGRCSALAQVAQRECEVSIIGIAVSNLADLAVFPELPFSRIYSGIL